MKKVKKPLKKSEIKNIIAQGWDARRAAAKMRSARNSRWTKEWKLRERKLSETVELKKEIKRNKNYLNQTGEAEAKVP